MKIAYIIKNPNVWLWLAGIYLLIWNIAKLVAALAPVIIIAQIGSPDGSLNLASLGSAYDIYILEAEEYLKIEPTAFKFLFAYSIVVAAVFLASVPFLLKKLNWARQIVLSLIALELVVIASSSIYQKAIPCLDTTLLYMGIFILLLLPSVSAIFKKESRNVTIMQSG